MCQEECNFDIARPYLGYVFDVGLMRSQIRGRVRASIEIGRCIWVPLERVRGICAHREKGVGAIVMQKLWSS